MTKLGIKKRLIEGANIDGLFMKEVTPIPLEKIHL